jgi:HEAT repeat protein
MNPRHARYVLVLLGALVVLLIGRAWMRARHNYDLLMDMQSKDPAVRIAAVKGLMPPDHLVDIVLAQPMKITETKTPSGTRLDVIATDTTVRTAAVDAVAEAAKLPDMQKQCIKALIGLLKGVDREASDPSQKVKDAEAAVRTKTWQYLGAIGEPALPDLLEALRDPSNTVRDGAVEALGIIGEPAVPGLMVAFRDRDRRGKAWAALDKIKKPALQPLIPLLKMRIPKDEGFPVDVASLLGSIDDPAAVPALLEQINDVKVPGLRRQVVRSLTAFGEFRDPRAVPRLIELLSHYDADVPPAAVAALQKIGKPSIPALLVAAKDKNAQRRANAVLALGSIGGPETVPVLLAAAKDADPSVRLSAVIGLGKLTGPDAVRATPVLVAHFTDEGEIASAAADSLQSIVANMPAEQASLIPSVLRPLVEAMGTQGEDLTPVYYASRVRARIGSRAAPVLAQELKSPSAWRRKWAALTLGDMEDKDAVRKEVPALQSLLADGNADVRWAASKALQKMGIVPNRQLASGY